MMKTVSFKNDVLPLKNVLYRLALRITLNPQDAEDIVQETMIKVWNKRDSWSQIDNIEAFCTTICKNLALDHARHHARWDDDGEPIGQQETAQGATPYEQTEATNRVEIVRSLINRLPVKQRSVLQLRDFEGKPYKEIAAALGMTEDQVKVNIFRARQAIKAKFNELDNYGL